jgi:hypothetical protein
VVEQVDGETLARQKACSLEHLELAAVEEVQILK